MRRRTLALSWLFGTSCFCVSGCLGIQGGSEGEEIDRCTYDDVPLSDPDAVPTGFDQSPRALLAPLATPLVGQLPRGVGGIELQFEPDYATVSALYRTAQSPSDCGPHLAADAVATLTLANGSQASLVAGVEIRWGLPLASARFEAAPNTPLAAIVPTFSGTPVKNPMLDVWLTDYKTSAVQSEWRWSALVPCTSGQCSGGPEANTEVNWGKATLTRQ